MYQEILVICGVKLPYLCIFLKLHKPRALKFFSTSYTTFLLSMNILFSIFRARKAQKPFYSRVLSTFAFLSGQKISLNKIKMRNSKTKTKSEYTRLYPVKNFF